MVQNNQIPPEGARNENQSGQLKIAVIVNPLIPVPPRNYGGIERIVGLLIEALTAAGHQVTLYANEHSPCGCRLIGYRESATYGLKDFIRINLLTGRIALKQFDLVHTFGRMSNITALLLSRIPKIVSYQLPPTLSQVRKAIRLARSGTLQFTGCSHYISDQIAPYARTTTIYNGVDLKNYRFEPTVQRNAPLVFLGRIQHEKGTHIAIAVAAAANRILIIAGNIPQEELHQQYYRDRIAPFIDGKKVIYIGPVDDLQKNDLLGKAAALLMPVTWDEPFGIVMAEALACGTPVIGFNRGAVPEVIIHELTGFVVSNENEMTEAVSRLASIDREACRQSVTERFSADVLAKQYISLYRQAIAKK